jgi:hypothetical protein
MNFIHHFRNVMDRIAEDPVLRGNHISLYMALFYHWNRFRFRTPLAIIREDMMQLSKIASTATYTRCLKDLERQGYLTYEPSCSQYRPSYVHLVNFEKAERKDNEKGDRNDSEKDIRKAAEKVTEPELNNTNLPNSVNDVNHDDNPQQKTYESENGDQSIQKIPDDSAGDRHDAQDLQTGRDKRPKTLDEVKAWFAEAQAPAASAEKFFHYYESIGWKAGGKATITNWKASARYWLTNEKTKPHDTPKLKPGNLHVAPGKDYSEPL